jgi:hypothetical protein
VHLAQQYVAEAAAIIQRQEHLLGGRLHDHFRVSGNAEPNLDGDAEG